MRCGGDGAVVEECSVEVVECSCVSYCIFSVACCGTGGVQWSVV